MTSAQRLELAEAARANVARVIALLERPTAKALDQSANELTDAIAEMEWLQSELARKRTPCPTKPVLTALRNDLRRAGLLLRHAWELRIGRGGPFGYTRKGELVPQQPASAVRWALDA